MTHPAPRSAPCRPPGDRRRVVPPDDRPTPPSTSLHGVPGVVSPGVVRRRDPTRMQPRVPRRPRPQARPRAPRARPPRVPRRRAGAPACVPRAPQGGGDPPRDRPTRDPRSRASLRRRSPSNPAQSARGVGPGSRPVTRHPRATSDWIHRGFGGVAGDITAPLGASVTRHPPRANTCNHRRFVTLLETGCHT